jgi:ATP-dependent Zn protease
LGRITDWLRSAGDKATSTPPPAPAPKPAVTPTPAPASEPTTKRSPGIQSELLRQISRTRATSHARRDDSPPAPIEQPAIEPNPVKSETPAPIAAPEPAPVPEATEPATPQKTHDDTHQNMMPAPADKQPAPRAAAPGSTRAISDHLLARIRGRTTGDSPRTSDSLATNVLPNATIDPNTQDVWEFFVMPVVQQIRERLQANALLPVFIVENPFPHYAKQLRSALATLCPELNTYQLDTRVSSNFQDLVIRMAEQRAFGMILFCTSRNQLPREFRSLVRSDGYLSIPLMRAERLVEYATSRFPQADVSDVSSTWASSIGPQELLSVNTLSSAEDWLAGLRQMGNQRIQVQSSGASIRLEDLHGVENAKRWAQQLFNDVSLAIRGKIQWKEVDRGALFAGPPGTGKTTLARAIALECGISFTAVAPVKDWMVGNGLDECIQLMSATFATARQQAPSILFIDEIDSLGNREKFQGQNESWNTAFLNALLSEIDGFDDRDQIIVIGATNHADNVDAALKRAGRLDRVIPISRPDVAALKAIYLAKLRAYDYTVSADELENCAALSLGLTGADIELLVRGARRRARMNDNRPITASDIQDEIFSIPPQAARKPLHGPELARTAYHEAGHALIGLLIPSVHEHVQIASIVSDDQGALGFVGIKSAGRNMTRSELIDRICVLMAGRAAEAIIYGEEEVSTGAGGYSTQNDLASARRLAEAALGVYGFSSAHPNWHTTTPDEAEAKALIAEQYARAKSMLESRRATLIAMSEKLQSSHVLDRASLVAFIEERHE